MVAGGPSPARTLMFSGCVSTDSPEGLENTPEKRPPQSKRFCPHRPMVLAGSEEDLGKDEPTGGAAKMQQEPVKAEEGERWPQDWRLGDMESSAKTKDGGRAVLEMAMGAALQARRGKKKSGCLCGEPAASSSEAPCINLPV
ncbi:transforming protein RhoA-like [Myotis daubentonii]|uniref:transforming protein RhoA-like n=1 Tax=Myotis daubentonii TaxID=98922 RepID=UPI0028739FC7|nr:transforming protein RhoA-like [Myotis daubentonii]